MKFREEHKIRITVRIIHIIPIVFVEEKRPSVDIMFPNCTRAFVILILHVSTHLKLSFLSCMFINYLFIFKIKFKWFYKKFLVSLCKNIIDIHKAILSYTLQLLNYKVHVLVIV